MIERIRIMLIVLIIVLSFGMLYQMYEEQADDLLYSLTDGRYGKQLVEEQTKVETETEEEQIELEKGTEPPVALPARYDCREAGKAPEVKNQGQLGTCWAVAATEAMESLLLPEEHDIFSADHMSLQNGFSQSQDEGGAYLMAMAYLTSWKGPVFETNDPYGDGMTTEGLDAVKHVQEIQLIAERDDQAIKKLVYEYGAVQSSVYMDMQDGHFTSVYYNPESFAYCYPGEQIVNHDLLIIGWDDDYPAENFTTQVSRNGAFICQNSWGSDFGENGVLYISYDDAMIGTSCVAYTKVELTDNYDYIYQSDLLGWVGQMGYGNEESCFANVYEAKGNQTVEAIGFYAVGPDTDYEIHCVDDFGGTVSLTLAAESQKGHFDNAGYYTVKLDEPFQIKKGKKFAIVVKIKTPGTEYPIAMEYQADETTQNADLLDGEGYVSANGIRWSSMEDEYDGNVCLKVYTVD